MTIKLIQDTIDNKDINALIKWLKTYPHLTKGEQTIRLEEEWSKKLGVKNSVFVNSGSSAILMMLQVLIEMKKINKGDNVVLSSLSWSTDLSSIIQLGLNPILCDCNLEDLSFDLKQLEIIIKEKKPKVCLLVSVLGLVPNMEAIIDICNKNNVICLEDTCESLGSKYKNKLLGSFGLMSIFSLYFGHHLSCIEGGMICTNDNEINDVLRSIRSHGWDRDMSQETKIKLREKYQIDDFNSQYTFYYCGFNFRSTDLQAFLGLRQLELKFDRVVSKRNKNYKLYRKYLSNQMWKPKNKKDCYVSNFAYPIISENREGIVKKLNKEQIENRPLICGSLYKQPFWIEKYGDCCDYELKNANHIHEYGFYIPNHPFLKKEEIEKICELMEGEL